MDVEKDSTIHMWWKRLTKERFDKTTDQLLDHQVSVNDYEAVLRGRWNRRRNFLFACIGYGVGLVNMIRFPILVHKYGGGTFVILYIFFSFILGLPLILLEMGLGQFTSLSNIQVYKCVPYLFGFAWSQVNLTIAYAIYYAVTISWFYIYLVGCFRSPLPWSSCNNTYNTPQCLSNYKSSLDINNTFRSSYQEYFYRYVLGIEKPNGELYTTNEHPGPIEWHRLLSLFFVWLVTFISIMCGINVTSKVVNFTALLPYLPLCFLFIQGCTLPGGAEGFLFSIKPNMTAFIQPVTYIKAFEHSMISIGAGYGVYMSLSSHNNFHDNFLRDGVCFILVDCITSVVSGSTGLTLLGYLAYKHNETIQTVLPSNKFGMYFLGYSEALTTISGSNIFTFLFMIANILLGMDSHFMMLESVMSSFIDVFIQPHYVVLFRLIGALTTCTICFLCGLLFITPSGLFYITILNDTITYFIVPTMVIFQCMTIGIIYGRERLRKDFQMMLGFALPKYLFIAISYLCPLGFSICTIYQVLLSKEQRYKNQLGYIIFFLILLFVFAPIFIGIFYILVIHKDRYEKSTLEQYVESLIKPPIYYGPRYKINWLLDTEYKKKLIKYRKDPEFLKHVSPVENIKSIISAIKQARSEITGNTTTTTQSKKLQFPKRDKN